MACEEENVLLKEKLDAAAKEDTQVFCQVQEESELPWLSLCPPEEGSSFDDAGYQGFFF